MVSNNLLNGRRRCPNNEPQQRDEKWMVSHHVHEQPPKLWFALDKYGYESSGALSMMIAINSKIIQAEQKGNMTRNNGCVQYMDIRTSASTMFT
jgi:hypothetical protein